MGFTRTEIKSDPPRVLFTVMRNLDGPLWVVGKNRDIEVNSNVPGVLNAHVHVHQFTAVDGHIGCEVVRTHRAIVVLKVNFEGFLGEHRDGNVLGEVHGEVGE